MRIIRLYLKTGRKPIFIVSGINFHYFGVASAFEDHKVISENLQETFIVSWRIVPSCLGALGTLFPCLHTLNGSNSIMQLIGETTQIRFELVSVIVRDISFACY